MRKIIKLIFEDITIIKSRQKQKNIINPVERSCHGGVAVKQEDRK